MINNIGKIQHGEEGFILYWNTWVTLLQEIRIRIRIGYWGKSWRRENRGPLLTGLLFYAVISHSGLGLLVYALWTMCIHPHKQICGSNFFIELPSFKMILVCVQFTKSKQHNVYILCIHKNTIKIDCAN